MDKAGLFQGAIMLGPMTKGSNLPYRRLCDELGASITMGEMALAFKLRKRSRPEFALLRRAESEKVFGVQLAGKNEDELAWATALACERGADLVDLNLGCPIHEMTRRGLGSALLQKPRRVEALVGAMKRAASEVPVTAKIRLGWAEDHWNHVTVARAAVAGGADAVVVHGRSRPARYRKAANWDAIGEVVAGVSVPIIGNGDILFPDEIEEFRRKAGCAGVMIARGALIKPWIFREAREGYLDVSASDRVETYRRYVALAREHWGDDERGTQRLRGFLLWHLQFWCRYVPRSADGDYPSMQEREVQFPARNALEAFLARSDAVAHEWIADRLLSGRDLEGEPPPVPENWEPARYRGDLSPEG